MSSPAPADRRYPYLLQLVSGALAAAAGLTALYGWYSGRLVLTSLGANLPRMHYIAAICFILCGAAISLSAFRKKAASLIFAGVLVVIAAIETLNNLFPSAADYAPHFGAEGISRHQIHATPIGSITFLFIGLAIFVMSRNRKNGPIVSGSWGAFSLACGLASIVGFAAGYANYLNWGAFTEISLLGAIAFLIAGVAIIQKSTNEDPSIRRNWGHYVPVAILVAGLTVAFCTRQYLHVQEVSSIDSMVAIELRNLKRTLESELSNRLLANERMAARWAEHGGTERSIWEIDAKRYFQDYGGYQAIEWVDDTYHVRWIIPFEENKEAIGLDLASEEKRRTALEKARARRSTTISEPITLVQGGVGFLSYTPIQKENEFMGFIVGVFRVETFFEMTIPKAVRNGYSVTITKNESIIYATDESVATTKSGLDQTSQLDLGERKYQLRIRPSQSRLEGLNANKDDLALLLGTLLALLLSGSVYLAQRARRHSAITAESNELLKSEIAGRKRIETMLRETSTFREAILNGANYLIISTDPEGRIKSFNRTAEYLLGYTAGEVVGILSLDHFHQHAEIEEYTSELIEKYGYSVEPNYESLIIRAREQIADEREWTYLCKDGSSFPVALSVTAIVDEFGQISGYLAIGRDNSQLHDASQRLIESEERFKAVVNNTPALVYIKDKHGRFIFSNNKFESLLGIEHGELIGKTVFDLTDKDTAQRVWETENRVLETGIPEESSELVLLGDQPLAHYLFVRFSIPTISQENCLGVIAIDLSPQLAVEEELREANRAAVESSRMKSEFLANMSHEIRTPMNGVLGMLEVLLDTTLNTSQREYAEVIQDSAKSLLTILDDILDFSRLEAGKLVFETIEFDLRATLENTVALFAQPAESKGIEITSVINPDVPTELIGDPGRFRQVLSNLLGNAVKFTQHGEITITVSKDAESGDKTTLRFEVEDTGIGISEDAQKSLFQAFVQADGSMVRKYGGTGLGLSISKQLVELMNGQIALESHPEMGSTFTFTAEFGIKSDHETIRPPVDLNGMKVLITDDLEANRKNIAYQLQGFGLDTHEAANGEECVEILVSHASRNEPFDIVILDFEMPGMNGFETTEKIKQNPELNHTKIVMMPSYGRRGHAHKAIQSGISAYLIKPIRQVELFDCVTTLMTGIMSYEGSESGFDGVSGLITRHSLLEKRSANGLPILIATDDGKNQGKISMQLELLGHRSELVSDGYEVISALKRRNYALILLDTQIPGLDGFETTKKIRNHLLEETLPIVGITSYPSRKSEKHAFAVGMNSYLSMPMSEDVLSETIDRLMSTKEVADDKNDSPDRDNQTDTDPSIEQFLQRLIELFGSEMAEMTVSLFSEDAGRHMNEFRIAVSNRDLDSLSRLSDSMQLVCETISATKMQNLCREIGQKASEDDVDHALKATAELESEFNATVKRLKDFSLAPAAG